MDPNETLRQLRKLTEYSLTDPKFDGYGGYTWRTLVEALGEHFQALDEWLSRGGRLPEAWLPESGPIPVLNRYRREYIEPLGPPDPAGVRMPDHEAAAQIVEHGFPHEDGGHGGP